MGKGGGAGRKTHTSSYDSANNRGAGPGRFMPIPADRDLREELGGVIFGATADTIRECLDGLVFGLPERHMTYVEYIEPGCPIFLFNYTDKKLHGIFEATTCGQLNINPHGWTGGTVAKTRYPAQVRVAWYARCTPLPEAVFKPVIATNYYADRRFLFELDASQATQLCALFKGQAAGASPARSPAPAASPARAMPPAAAAPLPAPPAAAAKAPAAASPAQRPAPPKQPPAPAPPAKAAAVQPLALAAPAAATAAGAKQPDATVFPLERTHAAACAALAQADPSVTAVVGEHLQACAATFASLRVEASAAAEARAEAARAKAEAAALRAELEALRAKAAAPAAEAPRIGTDAVEATRAAPLLSSCVFTVGGHDGKNWLSSMERLDLQAGSWEFVADMSEPRGYVAAATLPGASVLLVGGGAGTTFFDTVEAFDIATGTWRSCARLSERRGSVAAVTLKDDVYIFGGGFVIESTGAMCCFATTERYDAACDAWVQLAPLNCKRFGVGGAALGGALYAAGGFDGDAKLYMASAERFDPREGVWQPLPPMPGGARGSLTLTPAPGAAAEHTLVAAGGYYIGQKAPVYLNRVEAYDARANAWRPLSSLNKSRSYGAAVNVDGRLVLLGGIQGKEYADAVEEYDAVADAWRHLPLGVGTGRFRSFVGATCVRAAI